MTPLESRKQLLIAESELNRAQLTADWCAITAGVRTLTDRAKSLRAIITSAAGLVMALVAFRRGRVKNAGSKPSWWQSLLKGAGLLSTFWMAFRSAGRASPDSASDSTRENP